MMESKKTLFSTRDLVIIGLFSALAYVLMLLESPGYLGFLRIEFSDVPAILGGLGISPAAGVFIELIKNIIKDDLSEYLWKKIKRNPVILPIIMEAQL